MPSAKAPFNTEPLKQNLRKSLMSHNIDSATADNIVRDYEKNLTEQWDKQGIESNRFNEVFEEKGKAASRQ